jgi:hypothetical protein
MKMAIGFIIGLVAGWVGGAVSVTAYLSQERQERGRYTR